MRLGQIFGEENFPDLLLTGCRQPTGQTENPKVTGDTAPASPGCETGELPADQKVPHLQSLARVKPADRQDFRISSNA